MPEILSKTIHSFSSEDPVFPAQNLLETKVTKKWKCSKAGEKSCFVVLKLDQPRHISGIDIGNEKAGFIEVLVGNSQLDPPVFKEILLATSFMTIVEAKNETNPNRVRCFTFSSLVESVAKQKWDLVKIFCTQPFNNKLKYGLSFVTLHTPEELQTDDSPVKPVVIAKPIKAEESNEKKSKFGKFKLRADSDSDDDDKKHKKLETSPFNRWKSSKNESSQSSKPTIKEQMKVKIDENRKRIRLMDDSSDEEQAKPVAKPNRNRSHGLAYMDEDDEPNEKLQKKLDKDKETKEREQKTPKHAAKRERSPKESGTSKFSSFVSSDLPSTSSSPASKRDKSSSTSSSRDKPSSSSSRDKTASSSSRDKTPPRSNKPSFYSSTKSSPKPSPKKPEKKSSSKAVSYKPFHKLLEGVSFVFSGYVNPERGTLRQKAIDMGAKYKPDWDNNCTHLICAFGKTPKYQQVKGQGKIVTKRWIEACFNEQKRIPWRRFALDGEDKDEPESEEEIHNVLKKPKSPSKPSLNESDSDDDMVVVDKRVVNGDAKKDEVETIQIDDEDKANAMNVSTDDDIINGSNSSLTAIDNQVYKDKVFYLNEDLPATDVIKLKTQIVSMAGKITEKPSKANYIITTGKRLPENITGEVLTSLWVYECNELEALIPTTRYKPKTC